jgi:hypothetical protein
LVAAIEGLQTRTNIAAEIDSGIFYSLTLLGFRSMSPAPAIPIVEELQASPSLLRRRNADDGAAGLSKPRKQRQPTFPASDVIAQEIVEDLQSATRMTEKTLFLETRRGFFCARTRCCSSESLSC